MNALDSPLEALAFNYLSYGLLTVVNNIWTWVAVLTAAVSFWRIRASSDHPRGKVIDESCQTQSLLLSSHQVGEVAELSEPEHEHMIQSTKTMLREPEQEQMIQSTKSMTFCGLDKEESTKGKFTLYYYEEEEDQESKKCVSSGIHRARLMPMNGSGYDEGVEGEEVGEGWWSKWEMVMKTRKGDDEWYSYQDMNLISGNVVTMWDGCSFVHAGGMRQRR